MYIIIAQESGDEFKCKTLKECRDKIKDLKRFDRKNGIDEKYKIFKDD